MKEALILFLLGIFGLLLILGEISLGFGNAQLMSALLMACLPVPLYVGLALWIDRYEPEPPALLLGAFLWGASISALVSWLLNTRSTHWFLDQTGDVSMALDLSAVFAAPIVEELTKGLGLFLLYLYRSKDFDGIVDGVIYATMIALGFAMTENVIYYGKAIQRQSTTLIFLIRGVFAAFSHPLFTSMTGIGLGWACENRQREYRWLAPLGGLLVAMTLHCLWNMSATVHLYLFVLTYLGIMIPCALTIAIVVVRALGREGDCLRRYLIHEMPEFELQAVASISGRIQYSLATLLRQGPRNWLRCEQYLQTASQLAFLRRRCDEGRQAEPGEEARLRQRLQQLKARLSRRFSRPD